MPNEIVQLEENILGDDFIIGDVHGNAELTAVVNRLRPNDRLFIVGDLFDRGVGAVDVYNLISQDRRIYPVKGNHEEMLLDAMKPDATPDETKIFLENGGGWLSAHRPIQNLFNTHIFSGAKIPESFILIFQCLPKIPQAEAIKSYVSELPYIIRVGSGDNAFNVCHANLPISDKILDRHIKSSEPLSAEIKSHLIWARSKQISHTPSFDDYAKARSKYSIPVYCGHNILNSPIDAVRKSSNHINLDGGAYLYNFFIMVNHTKKTVEMIGGTHWGNIRQADVLREAIQTISKHIRKPRPVLEDLDVLISRFNTVLDSLKKSKKDPGSEEKYADIVKAAHSFLRSITRKPKATSLVNMTPDDYFKCLNKLIAPILIDKLSTLRFITSNNSEQIRALLQSGEDIITRLDQEEASKTSHSTRKCKRALKAMKSSGDSDSATQSMSNSSQNSNKM